jgi:predicted ester cyclase
VNAAGAEGERAMSEANKAIIRRLYHEAIDMGNLAVVDETYAPDVELHVPGIPEDPYGPGPVKQLLATMRVAFPGLRVTIEDLIAEGDTVAARVTFRQPHDGTLDGVSPRLPQGAWVRLDIFRLFRGRIVEQWADRDDSWLLRQLGVRPAAG